MQPSILACLSLQSSTDYNPAIRPPPIPINNIILTRRTIDRIRHQDWSALIGELIIVVLGIFIAIQADRWWKHQDELQQEQIYIARLTEDLERDVDSIEHAIALAEYRYALSNLLIAAAVDPEVVRQRPAEFMTAIHQSSYTHTPSLNSDTFEELRSTGGLSLLRDNELKSALFEYYRYDQDQRQYLSLQLMIEFRHFELAAGILTNEQYIWLQDEIGYVDYSTTFTVEFTPDHLNALVEAAQRIKDSPEFVAWLPEARSMQLDLKDTHESRLKRATALLVILHKLDRSTGTEAAGPPTSH